MYDINLYNNYIKPVVDRIIKDEAITSAYIIGSFTTTTMWKPGVSDIDMILLSSEAKHDKKEIDITECCKSYIDVNKLQHVYNYNKKELFVISYVIWNSIDFQNTNIWRKYASDNEKEKSVVIEDQLLFSEVKELVYGDEIGDIKVSPKAYREYLSETYEDISIPKNSKITLLTEVKKILITCRIFYYLWTGDYIYNNDILLDLYKKGYENEIYQTLKFALDIKFNINNYLGNQQSINTAYLSNTLRLTKKLKVLLNIMTDIDNEFCQKNGEKAISTKFIEAYGVLNG